MTPLDLATDALATYRITRLVTTDAITAPARKALNHRGVGGNWLADLVSCPWCTGVWVAFGVVAARRVAPRDWVPIAQALALSAAAGLASEW